MNRIKATLILPLIIIVAATLSALLVMSCANEADRTPAAAVPLSVTGVMYESAYADADFSPNTTPDGREMVEISSYDFTEDGYGFVYNYDWASYTYALDYGTHNSDGEDMYRLRTCGGGLQPRIYAYAADGSDISGAEWVSMYVDMRGLADSSDNSVGFYLYLSTKPKLDDQASSSSAPLFLREGASGYYYDTSVGEWRSSKVENKTIDVGADFAGVVCFPLSAFHHVKEDGRAYVSTAADAEGLFSAGYRYLCRVWTFCEIADTSESHTEILFDDITFFRSGGSHAHTYAYTERVSPTCYAGGYDVYECTGCGQQKKTALTSALPHSYAGVMSYGSLTFSECTGCGRLEPCSGNGAECADEVFSVTFIDSMTGESTIRLYRRGDVIRYSDVPTGGIYVDKYTYQFNAWTTDSELIEPTDPDGVTVEGDMVYYGRYLISDYSDKYVGAVSVLAQNGGPYVRDEGRVVVLGNSNMSLYHGMEDSFAASGIPVYNNSISGSTSYEMIDWFRILIAPYRPSAIVLNITTNDMAYYNLTERQILENMIALYDLTRELIPDTYIFFVTGNPLPGRTEYTETIIRTNNAMARFCEKNEGCELVDVYARVLAVAEKYPTGWDTWTHMNQQNLKLMFDDIKSAILAWKQNNGITF